MKRLLALGFVGLMGTAISGCPIYSHDNMGCYDSYDCPAGEYCDYSGYCVSSSYYGYGGGYYYHPDGGVGGAVVSDASSDSEASSGAVYCGNPNDCASGQTCAIDGTCHPGDCTQNGCINQFVCTESGGTSVCATGSPSACGEDTDCASSSRCIDGACTAAAELCSDGTQCAPAEVCAAGKCVTSCATDAQCGAGFRCRLALGICDVPAKVCVKTNDCGDPGLVCVSGACVPRCSAAGACGGDASIGACVFNGCQPRQGVVRQCNLEGQQDTCQTGQICLHHHCYVSCDAEGGTCSGTDQCKSITIGTGTGTTYSVCSPATSLGTECDPTRGLACSDDAGAAKTCIDGFCK